MIWFAASLCLIFIAVPLLAIVMAAPWSDLGVRLADGWEPLGLSLFTATVSTAIAIAIGIPLAWLVSRRTGWSVTLIRGLLLVPIVLPPVVSGVALTAAFGRSGMLGRLFDDYTLAFTTSGAVVAVLFVSLPFLVLAAEAGFRQVDSELFDMGATHGMGSWQRFRKIAIPMASGPIVAGIALAWSRAVGEFGATITFAGNRPGVTQTLPLAVFLGLERGLDQAIALSLLAIALAVGAAGAVWWVRN